MKKNTAMVFAGIIALVAITIITGMLTTAVYATEFSGAGAGTESNPYVITTCTQLQEIDQNLNAYYVLGNDIDCSATNPENESNSASIWADGKGFNPIGGASLSGQYVWNGFSYENFIGVLDGQDHKITNLFINRGTGNSTDIDGYYVGLFGTIGVGAEVKNLGLEDVDITGSDNVVGALAGGLSGTVTNVYSTGVVNGGNNTGGLIGVHVDANNFPNSSPLVYTWDGKKYTYTVDVGGFLPKELTGIDIAHIDSNKLAPKNGKYSMKITEEYNEVVYYDELALMTFDHQPGYSVVAPLTRGNTGVDDMRTISDTPTHPLVSCVDDRGADCAHNLRAYDDKWSYTNENGTFNKQNLKKYWILDFGDLSQATNSIQLVMRGARNYEASAKYPGNSARSVQVKDSNGNWVEIYNRNQLDSDGSPRLRMLDLTGKFLTHNYQVKVAFDTFNANYFAIDTSEQVPFTAHTYHPESVELGFYGFSAIDRTHFMDHDYSKVTPVPETPFKHQYGKFTKYGDVTALLSAGDDQPVVMRYGDQMSVEFPYEEIAPGMVRSFMLYNDALYKHATYEGSGALSQSSDYLPYRGMTKYSLDMTPYPMTESNVNYINTWNTRVIPGPFPDANRTGGSTIIDSYSTAEVNGDYNVGGLVGLNHKEIRRSYATGNVTGYGDVGGLVGANTENGVLGWIRDSYARGNVSGTSYVGGLAGYNNATIERSYSTGSVSNTGSYAGGLVGLDNPGTEVSGIFFSFTTSDISGTNPYDSAGGFVGYGYSNDYSSFNNYWYSAAESGVGNVEAVAPAKVESAEYFQSNTENAPLNGWNFEGIWASTLNVNNNYPYLRWQASDLAPDIEDVIVTPSDTSATITWETNAVRSSSQVFYSISNSYYANTPEYDTETLVHNHSVTISELLPCTTYYFKLRSVGVYDNVFNTSAETFTTTGCSAGSTPDEKIIARVDSTAVATTTLAITEGSKSFTVVTPENFSTASTTIVIQIKSLDKEAVLGAIGVPNNLTSAGSIVFDVKALINSTTTLDSFDIPVTITYTYSDADIAGIDESSLVMYHYHDSTWSRLDNCSVNTATNTITCNAPHFSIFSLFGTPTASAAPVTGGSAGGGTSFGCTDPSAANYERFVASNPSMCIYRNANGTLTGNVTGGAVRVTNNGVGMGTGSVASSTATSSPLFGYRFTRTLQKGTVGADVLELQKLLNLLGFTVATTGPGSKGKETTRFGPATQSALIKFQKARNITPAIGIFGPITRASIQTAR
jgi:hypothetical protein